MANQPSDVRWPPGTVTDFDEIRDRILELKSLHFPEHTATDLADPYIQVLTLVASLGQHAFGRLNHALLQLAPKSATSRRALNSMLAIVNRPLLPIQPSRGPVYARLVDPPTVDTEIVPAGQRISQPSITDPTYSVDTVAATGSAVAFLVLHQDDSAGTITALSFPASITLDDGDSLIIEFTDLFFDAVDLVFTTPLPNATATFSFERINDEFGPVDSVTNLGATLEFVLDTYLHQGTANDAPGLSVSIRHKSSGISETVTTTVSGGSAKAITSFLGQSAPSTSASDYEIFALWRPIPNTTDATLSLSADGTISFPVIGVKSVTDDWPKSADFGYALRARNTSDVGAILPATLAFGLPTNTGGDFYADVLITQGLIQTQAIGQADGTAFQHIPVPNEPVGEPVADPEITLEVAGETDWFVVDDFSNSGPTSRHAIFREDVDDGFGIIFGDGTLGELPSPGDSVKVTFRTASVQPGDIDPGTQIRLVGGPGLVSDPVLFRGTDGFQVQEASDRESVQRFRFGILPQLALRAESAITEPEIETAMSGGAPNRATFETSDGRKPFSRAKFSLTGAGDRQYRVLVVGSESDDDGSVGSADLIEGAEFLNGVDVGVERVGGRGPQNTEALMGSFVQRVLLPTVTITVTNAEGVRDQVDQIIKQFFKPHSRDENGVFRWQFGGRVPMPVLFGLLWDSVPNRTFVDIEATDGVTVFQDGDSVQLAEFELPVLDPAYDKLVNIIIVVS